MHMYKGQTMMDGKEGELDKRVQDIKAIRALLADGKDIPLIHPWAFFAWALLVGAATLANYLQFKNLGISLKDAISWIWLPVLVIGTIAEGLSFAIRAREGNAPLFNRRLGGAILTCIASMIVIAVIAARLAPIAMTPGIAILLAALPLVFYAQVCYASLFIETFVGIAFGLAFELAGARGSASYLIGGSFVAALYAASGIHTLLTERRSRG
jgi:hypothetical protein